MYRKSFVEINLNNLKYNINRIINSIPGYKYYFGVCKADAYGHGIKAIETIINSGCNYLAVATLDEALEIRTINNNIPILCLGIIDKEYINICSKNDITITISNLNYIKSLKKDKKLKVHIKINTGMNRLGVNNKKEFNKIYSIAKNNFILEGLYTHIYDAENKERTLSQFKKFEEITNDINLKEIPIIHLCASDASINYPKKNYVNGCRLGIVMYGLNDKNEGLKSTFSLYSKVIQINEIENETVGYNGVYKASNKERIAVIPIGYADGIIRKNTGRMVYINNKEYKIVGNICMDMLFVCVDKNVHVNDKVTIIKDNYHIKEIAKYLDTIPYEVICMISKRVPRIYINNIEYFDVFDINRKYLGYQKERGQELNENEYNVGEEIWIFNNKKLLITKRSTSKSHPNKWEVPGGCSQTLETSIDTLRRELSEEIGINIYNDFKLVGTKLYKHQFVDIYVSDITVDLKNIKLQKEEVSNIKFVTKKEFSEMIKNNEIVPSICERYELIKDKIKENW